MRDPEFRKFVENIGSWFDGMTKFVDIVNRHVEGIYSGEQLMLDRLKRHTLLIDKHLKELREKFASEDEEILDEEIRSIQHALVRAQQVGKAMQLSFDEFWQELPSVSKQVLQGVVTPQHLLERCLYQPVRTMFESPHRLSCLDDALPSALLAEAVHDGIVTVQIGKSSTAVIMDGNTPHLVDACSLAELLDCGTACVITIGGLQIVFEEQSV